MKKIVSAFALLTLPLILEGAVFPWEPFDRVIAVVNESPIIESEVVERVNRAHGRAKLTPKQQSAAMSRIIDKLIERALVEQEAQEQYIIVSDKKIDAHIEKLMERMNISSLDDFKKRIQATQKMKFEDYREELKISIMTEQVMSLAIGVSPPTTREAMDWYNANRQKLGFEVNVKHILLRPANASLAEEKRVNAEMKKLLQRIYAGESFESIARKHSQDPGSAQKGGDLGWVPLAELDPYFANQAYRMNKPGQLSGVVKSSFGYHIIKYLDRRPISFDSVKDRIFNMLFQQKMGEQFGKWIQQRRERSEIKIYMDNYVRG